MKKKGTSYDAVHFAWERRVHRSIETFPRSTASSGSSSGVSRATAAIACGKFHYSLFEFAATENTMLSVARGQVVRVIQVL